MGVKIASAAFQAKIIHELDGVNGTDVIQDDCLVEGFGTAEAIATDEHDKNLQYCLQRCRERGIKLNLDKCCFLVDSVTYGTCVNQHWCKGRPTKNKCNS